MYHIEVSKEMGRGLYATRTITPGTFIEVAELLVLSPEDTIRVNQTDLKYYTFVYDKVTGQDCLVLGDGEIFNHSDTPNVRYRLQSIGDRMRMAFVSTRTILEGEQLFIDYSADTAVDTNQYKDKNLTR